jgi:DNA-binding CsgD family transcriptional regulator
VSEHTVKFHLTKIYRKLGVAGRSEAAHYAHAHRLVDVDPHLP